MGDVSFPQKVWGYILGYLIEFGYSPWRALLYAFAIILIGSVIFGLGFSAKVMSVSKGQSEDTCSNMPHSFPNNYLSWSIMLYAFIYSIDVFLPVVDLKEGDSWQPNANMQGTTHITEKKSINIKGSWLRYWLWFQTAMGWVITTLLIAGLTGLIRK